MDRKLSITDVLQYFLQFGVDALNILFSIWCFGICCCCVRGHKHDPKGFVKKESNKKIDQKEKLQKTQNETPEEKKRSIPRQSKKRSERLTKK